MVSPVVATVFAVSFAVTCFDAIELSNPFGRVLTSLAFGPRNGGRLERRDLTKPLELSKGVVFGYVKSVHRSLTPHFASGKDRVKKRAGKGGTRG